MADRGEQILDAIYDDVDQELNPSGEDCPTCGGEEYIFDCFDGCCVDCDVGCDDCTRECPECRRHKAARAKAVREEVIRLGDVDVAIAWLKQRGRWHEETTREEVQAKLTEAAAQLAMPASVSGAKEP